MLAVGLQAQPPSLSAADIAAKSIEAMGGAATFASIDSIQAQGHIRFGQGPFTPFTVIAKRPNRFRMELNVGSDHVTQGYDGAIAWQLVSGQHAQEATALTGESLAHLIDQASNAIGGPLLEPEKRHNKLELLGNEKVDGVDCYKLKVTLGTGDTMMIFINPANFRETQEELPIQLNGKPSTIQKSVSLYKRFPPILVACLFVTREKGGEDSQRMEIDTVQINPSVEDSIFKMPAAK